MPDETERLVNPGDGRISTVRYRGGDRRIRTWAGSLLGGFVLGLVAVQPVMAGAPMDLVKTGIDRVLRVVQDPELKKPANTLERRKRIRAVANELFDWEETGKRSLARHWQTKTPQQRAEFTVLFSDLIERSYVRKIEAYSGEQILYTGESIEGDVATVNTKIVTRSGADIPIDYRLLREGNTWRIYDFLIEGVSLVSNYRSQFNRIIQQTGYDDLIKKMRVKQEELLFDESEKAKKTP
jgi:phospholipid transport system substrate-binding protein